MSWIESIASGQCKIVCEGGQAPGGRQKIVQFGVVAEDCVPSWKGRHYRPYLPIHSVCDSTCPFMARSRSFLLAPAFTSSLVSRAYNRSEEHTSELQSLRHLVCR